ncbi:MAG: sensor histidine kinase [Coriobacteriales bacterium]
MERITDKLIVFVVCLPALALVVIDARVVVAVLVALGVSAVCEVCAVVPERQFETVAEQRRAAGRRRARRIASPALASTYCVAACLAPEMALFVALPAYDLVFDRSVSPLVLLVALVLLRAVLAGMSGVATAIAACASLASVLLSVRSSSATELRGRTISDRDALRERSLKLEERNRDLLERQEYEARLATLTERGRIAREIHDNVGHLLTRAVMQVEALRVVHADDARAEQEFASVAGTLHEAYDTMRTSVHALADDACDLSVQLRQVVSDACADSGIEADCDIAAGEASPRVTACLVAVTREALSNTLRHADGATRVRVELVEHPRMWRLSVVDDGQAPCEAPDGQDGRGMGLATMDERVRALGGSLHAGYSADQGGFVVFASVPKGEA